MVVCPMWAASGCPRLPTVSRRKRAKGTVVAMGKDRTGLVSHPLKWMLLVVVTGLLALPAVASAAPPPVGGLTQLPGASGCFADTAKAGSCQAANGLFGPESTTVSPDGKFVYVGSYPKDGNGGMGLAVFARDAHTGALTPVSDT